MISSEDISASLGAVLELQKVSLWSSGLRIQLRGESVSAADTLKDGDWLENLLCDQVHRVESLVERLPGFPVDEKIVRELFWLVDKVEELQYEKETGEPDRERETQHFLDSFPQTPATAGQLPLRRRLEEAVDAWRVSYEDAQRAEQIRKAEANKHVGRE